MTVPAPDPTLIRETSLGALHRLRLPAPPPHLPLVWEPGDRVDVRPRAELETRVAILNVALARSFGMSPQQAMQWLLHAHLVDRVTAPEWHVVVFDEGDSDSFALHLEAMFALTWVMGQATELDPLRPSPEGLVERLPNLADGESFAAWRSRTLTPPREPHEVAALLDLYHCLDWAYLESERRRWPLPGLVDSNTISQRRCALEWTVVINGRCQDLGLAGHRLERSNSALWSA